jgi:hypothetical protein
MATGCKLLAELYEFTKTEVQVRKLILLLPRLNFMVPGYSLISYSIQDESTKC